MLSSIFVYIWNFPQWILQITPSFSNSLPGKLLLISPKSNQGLHRVGIKQKIETLNSLNTLCKEAFLWTFPLKYKLTKMSLDSQLNIRVSLIPPTLFFFKITVAIQGLLWFHIKFWNMCSTSVKYAPNILIRIVLSL